MSDKKFVFDYDNFYFVPKEEGWEDPWDDNTVREGRDEYYVTVIATSCDDPDCNQGNCNEHSDGRDFSSVRITRNRETQKFILYVDGESIVEAQWTDTPSGRGPNGHYRTLMTVKAFAKGWMAAEHEVPVKDIHVHSEGPSND